MPMRRFISDQLCDEAGERANLNLWAFWNDRTLGIPSIPQAHVRCPGSWLHRWAPNDRN